MKYFPYILFFLIAFGVMAPLYTSGYVFLLDMVWGPGTDLTDATRNGIGSAFPISVIIISLSAVFGAVFVQKLMLTFVLFLPGVSMYVFARRYMDMWLASGAGVLYMLNPFVIERFLAGHFLVLLGYGFLPLSVLLLLRFFDEPSGKRWLYFSLGFAIYPILNLHFAYIAGLFLLALGGVYVVRHKKFADLISGQSLKRGAIFIGLLLLVNSFWLVGFFDPSQQFINIGRGDFEAFITQPDPLRGVYLNVLSLYGIWHGEFLLPKHIFTLWWLLGIAFLLLAAVGAHSMLREGKGKALGVAVLLFFIPAFLISVGYGSTLTRPFIDLLASILPLFKGLRDTAKTIGFLAFTYALLVPLGVYALIKLSKLRWLGDTRVVFGIVMVLMYLSAGSFFWGARGQLETYAYPEEWYTANQVLLDEGAGNALFVPWRGYLSLDFANSARVTNPAHAFFETAMIAGRNTDNAFLLDAEENAWNDKMFQLVHQFETFKENREYLLTRDVTHVVLGKVDDFDRWEPLLEGFDRIYDSDTISVYRIDEF